jgi:predicted HAD superfamily Cof-like phosphohydrolase
LLEQEESNVKTNFRKVEEFMDAFGQKVEVMPTLPDFNVRELRLELILEEVEELVTGIDNEDLVEIADALTDILYVTYGAGHTFGIDLDACFDEVHRSNMSKLDENGKAIYRADGKVLKGPNYFPPDLSNVF